MLESKNQLLTNAVFAFSEKLIFRFYFLTGAADGVASPVFKAAPMAGI